MTSLSYLKKCIPAWYARDVNSADSLNHTLSNLSLWTESQNGLSGRIHRSLHDLPQGHNILEDQSILKRQIALVKQGLRISSSFWITFSFAQSNFAKYCDPRGFIVMRAQLVSASQVKHDIKGVLNYARDLLRILQVQSSLVNERIVHLQQYSDLPSDKEHQKDEDYCNATDTPTCKCESPGMCMCYF